MSHKEHLMRLCVKVHSRDYMEFQRAELNALASMDIWQDM
jgi:hypothetical protein